MQTCVQLWEKLRPHDVPPQARVALVDRILDTMRGKVVALSQNHSTSRVVQAVIKHGSDANRQDILAEMLPHVLDLSRSQHGHFCVVKLIHVLASTRAKKEREPGAAGARVPR